MSLKYHMIKKSNLILVIKKLNAWFREWVGKAIAACLVWMVVRMAQARQMKLHTKSEDAVKVSTESDQTMTESIVSAQYGLIRLHQLIQHVNITIMKLRSIYASKVTTKYVNLIYFVVVSKMCSYTQIIACKHGDGVDFSLGNLFCGGAVQVGHHVWYNILLCNDIECREIHEQRSE